MSESSLEHANKSLKTFRDEIGKAEKNVITQKNALKKAEESYSDKAGRT